MVTQLVTQTILPNQLEELVESGAHIDVIDVRTPVEFRAAHLECALNVPLDRLDPTAVMASRNGNCEEPLYVVCRSGNRAEQASKQFAKAGYTNVVNVEGGMQACEIAGLPIVYGKKAISLDRQVRIAAGFLVLLGVVLGWLVHPAFFGLSAFVGAGLLPSRTLSPIQPRLSGSFALPIPGHFQKTG